MKLDGDDLCALVEIGDEFIRCATRPRRPLILKFFPQNHFLLPRPRNEKHHNEHYIPTEHDSSDFPQRRIPHMRFNPVRTRSHMDNGSTSHTDDGSCVSGMSNNGVRTVCDKFVLSLDGELEGEEAAERAVACLADTRAAEH